MKFKNYTLFYKRQSLNDSDWKQTNITFKARNEKEAMRKANKFWQNGDMGAGSIYVKEI